MNNWFERWREAKAAHPDAIVFLQPNRWNFCVYGDDAKIVRRECQNWLDLQAHQSVVVDAGSFWAVQHELQKRGFRVEVANIL